MVDDEIYLRESAGYLGLRLWLSEMGDVGRAEEVARDWMRDGYILFGDGELSSGLVWQVELESENAADLLEGAARERVEMIWAEGRYTGATRVSPKVVRLYNVATAETAAKLATP